MSKTFLLDWQYFFLLPIRTLNPQPPFPPPHLRSSKRGYFLYPSKKENIYVF